MDEQPPALSGSGTGGKPGAFLRAFVCGAAFYALAATVMIAFRVSNLSYWLGYSVMPFLLAAIVTGVWSHFSKKSWSWLRVGLTAFAFYFVFAALAGAGARHHNDTPQQDTQSLAGNVLERRASSPSSEAAESLELNRRAVELYNAGKYSEALPLAQRALALREKAFEPGRAALVLNNLSAVYVGLGDYTKAKLLCQQSLDILEKALGPNHPDIALTLNNLADVYCQMGDYAKAEAYAIRAVKVTEKALGPNHPDLAARLNSLGVLYSDIGDDPKAQLFLERALSIWQTTQGPEHPNVARGLSTLGVLYSKMKDFDRARESYQRALTIRERVYGPDHPDVALSLSNLAVLSQQRGNYAEAESLLQRALSIAQRAYGSEHHVVAHLLQILGEVYDRMGAIEKAEATLQRSLKITETRLGPAHPNVAVILSTLALLAIEKGDRVEALKLTKMCRQVEEKTLANILSFTSEQQRLLFQKTTHPYILAGTLGDASELAETVLRQKGIVLDSLLEDRTVAQASSDPRQREVIEQLRTSKQRLTRLLLEVPKDLSEEAQKQRIAEKEKLSTEVEQLETGLARRVTGLGKARRALSVTAAQIQSALPKKGILVELLRYNHYLGKNQSELRYGAIVLAPALEPQWVPLGAAETIEKNIRLYAKSVRGETDGTTLNTVLKALGEEVWAPIQKTVPLDATTIIVSPDAELSFVSFATMLTLDDKFVGEKYSIRYVASGRDLLREPKPAADSKPSIRVFANPYFALDTAVKPANKTNEVALRSVEMRDLQAISLPELPGTAKESEKLEMRAKESGWQAQVTLGSNATEAELRKTNSPRILHLATHGFFLPEIDLGPPPNGLSRTAGDIPKGKLVNPMHRSGLAASGAQTTLHAWANGEVPPTENDGIVTAEEVGGLNLDGTWLVVLSACDTGGGEAKAGEGVMGLRRGFVQAGTQNLLMTLWPISDETTVNIMLDFYDVAFKTGNAPQALADTQRDWLVKLRKEKGLLAAVRLAGPFIMSSQGKP